jgi:multiple sugar transport system permease protein/lactose/L-arabinose transport system permease protein
MELMSSSGTSLGSVSSLIRCLVLDISYLSFFQVRRGQQSDAHLAGLGFYTFELNRIADLQYVGLANYARLFGDGLFHQALFTLL